ncbi:MAG: hypothetical protein DI587_13725 [Variovorax paradoxus]|nr:MAG: hypothetical protein DI583_13725 [Variovorax paradoxus]PZQ10127.1 MAG: hypothetical protein DI587_13725 [Variovorax paradoxus]
MGDDTSNVVRELIAQQTQIFELFGDERVPRPRPPVTESVLAGLHELWAGKGGILPPSYIAFLRVCDGIEDFSFSYDLYGACDLLTDKHASLSARLFEENVGLPVGDTERLILLGSSPETTTRLIADLRHQPLKPGESVIFDGDPGFLSLHASYGDFLRMRVQANRLTIDAAENSSGIGEEE